MKNANIQNDPIAPLEKQIADLRVVVEEFARGYTQEFEKLGRGLAQLEERRPTVMPADIVSRLEALELWKGKVHGMLIEQSPATGREKVTKRGRTIGALLAGQTKSRAP